MVSKKQFLKKWQYERQKFPELVEFISRHKIQAITDDLVYYLYCAYVKGSEEGYNKGYMECHNHGYADYYL